MKRTGKKCLQAVLPAILLCAPAMASSARSISRIRGGKVAVLSEIEAHDAIREIGEEKSRDPFAVFGDSRQSSKKDIPSAQSDVLDFLRENDLLQPQGETICEVSGDIKSSNLGRKEFAHASAYYHCHTSFGTYNTNTYPTTSSVRCATMWNGTWHNPAGVDPSPPSFQDISIPTKTATSFDVYVDLSKSSTLYAVLLLPTAPAPTSAQVKAGTDGSGSAALQTKTQAVTVDPYTATLSFTGVDTVNNKYVVYLVGDDGSQLTATPGVANTAFLNGTVFTSTNYYVWPHIEASDNGNFYVAYWDGANNRYTVSKWNEGSMTWGAYTAFSNSATGTYQLSWGGYERAAFAVSSPNATTDNLHLVFNAGTTNMAVTNDPYYGLHNGTGIGTTDGTGWTFNKAVDDVNYADNFDIFYDSSGKVHITYELYDYVNDTVCTNDYYRLRYVKNTAGAFPQSYTTVQTNQGCDSLELQDTYIVRESGGLTHVFYGSEQDPWHTGYYYRSSADNFASATLLLDSCAVASCPSDPSNTNRIYWSIGDVVMDAGDKVHMVYSDETNGKAYYRTNKTGSWVTTEITTPGLSGLQAIDLQVIDNTVYIAMNSSAGYYIKAYDGSTWYDGTRFNLDGYLRQFAIETVNNRVMLISEISSNPYKVNYHTGLLSDYVTTFSNSAPTIGGTSAGQAVNDTSTIAPFSSVTIGDGDGDNVTTTITLDSNAKGVFTPASLTASGFTGTGPYSLALTTPANAQTAIRQLVYNPTDNRVAAGSSETTTFTIAVNDGTDTTNDSTTTVISTSMNDAPMITSNGGGATASTSINENTTAVITVTASDVDPGTTLTYSISGGIDQALFSINSSSGALVFASAPNYESPTDSGTNNIYDVQVTATDNGPGLLTDVQDIAVTVNNVNENPVITSNGGGTTASVNAPENQTGVTTVTATDQDSGDTLTYSITGGADQALFNINSSTGVLTFASAPNYESPTDSGANGVYDVQITVTDDGSGTLTDVQAIAVTVTNINEAPVITSNGGGATASTSVNENSTAVTTVTATDVDTSDTLTYSISGGIDQALFSINSSTGALTFASAPNYESPADFGANNVYNVQVTVTDNGTVNLTDVQAIAVTVNNINENPVITSNGGGVSASVNAPENQTAVTTVTATDQDTGDTLTYSITGGADQALFDINSSTGVLTFASAPNYESPADSGSNGIYDVQVTVTDNGTGNLTDVQAIAVTVTNANEAPVITSNGGSATAAVNAPENQTSVTTVTATDVDTSDTLTYSLSGGADQTLFSINSSTGALTFNSAPDYENPTDFDSNNVYDVQVTVTDDGPGTLTDVQAIAVTVTDANDAPVITSNGGGASASVNAAENQTAVTTVTATDVDAGDTLTYSISGGADQAGFNINPSTGVLTFASAPDYENPTDAGANNVYDVQITVTDDGSGSLTDVQAIAVIVTNANEAPVITSNGGGATATLSAVENQTSVTTVTATDVDAGDTLTYSISGGADAIRFFINVNSGALSFTTAPDYENPTDSGADNVYDVQVTVTDNGTGALTDTQAIAVTVTDANDAPVFTGTPRITGAVRLKGTARLTDTGTSDPDSDPVTLSYQWQIDSADVAGAITPVYAIQPTELGKTLTCTITADDGNGGISNHTTQGVVIKDRFPWLDIIPGLVSPNKMTGGN